jgi:hypothetical protein
MAGRVLSQAGMRMPASRFVLVIAVVAVFAGCTSAAAGTSNFSLKPTRIGWYAGEAGSFHLNLTPSMVHKDPDFVIDRHFAIEELRFEERGANFGGDYQTRNMDDVHLVLGQDNSTGDEFHLDGAHPSVQMSMDIPTKLRDSEYTLELKLFNVGWVKSEPFRVDDKGK